MTPTTVEPEIVAAAANAGYWAELAGGGQVTAEVFDRHIAALEDELEEGRTVEFNAMFMDRYLWNLQFGSSRIVPKKRTSARRSTAWSSPPASLSWTKPWSSSRTCRLTACRT